MNYFEKYKIFTASTDKVVTNVYLDAFAINKVRLQNFKYETKETISCYLDFPVIARLAADVASGRLFNQLKQEQLLLSMGGSKKSATTGKPEARTLSLGLSGNKVFINMRAGLGTISETGLIAPVKGETYCTISVGMSIDTFRELILYVHDCVNAYLSRQIPTLVKEVQTERDTFRG